MKSDKTILGVLWIAVIFLMLIGCSCTFSLFPEQKQPKTEVVTKTTTDSSGLKRIDSLIGVFTSHKDSANEDWAAKVQSAFDNAPPVTEINETDNPLLSAVANERDWWKNNSYELRQDLVKALDEIRLRDTLIAVLRREYKPSTHTEIVKEEGKDFGLMALISQVVLAIGGLIYFIKNRKKK